MEELSEAVREKEEEVGINLCTGWCALTRVAMGIKWSDFGPADIQAEV